MFSAGKLSTNAEKKSVIVKEQFPAEQLYPKRLQNYKRAAVRAP